MKAGLDAGLGLFNMGQRSMQPGHRAHDNVGDVELGRNRGGP